MGKVARSGELPGADSGLDLPAVAPAGTTLASSGTHMAIREFTDLAGVAWRVWETTPRAGAVYDERLKGGWLTFESATVRKRLAPIPRGWQEAVTERLDLMCRAAEVVRRASGTAPLSPDPEAPESPGGSRRPDGG
jgi:hypothetical protein